MIIGVDFDGTVVEHAYPQVGGHLPGAIKVLLDLVEAGHRLVLFTMRHGKELRDAVNYLEGHGVHLYGVNVNPTQHEWTTSPKAYADLYIDDAALGAPLRKNVPKGCRPEIDWLKVRLMLEKKGIL